MSRTTPKLVSEIIRVKGRLDEQKALVRSIQTADILVTRVCVPFGVGYDETDADDIALLAEIVTYLAAHFFSCFKPRRSYEQAGSVAQRVISAVDMGLQLTHHGQQAMLLDVNGGLVDLNARQDEKVITPSLTWLGTVRT